MTIEERVELHDQWLHSMESNHAQLVEDLGRMKERQDAFEAAMSRYLTSITMNLAAVIESEARAGARQEQLEQAHLKLTQDLDTLSQENIRLNREVTALREIMERYIRFRGDGREM